MTRFLAVMACLLVVVCIVPQVAAGTSLTVTDPTQFTMRVRAVTAGTTVNGSPAVALTAPGLNTAAEYYQMVVTIAGAAGWHVVELDVPDCYMGLSVEQLYPNGSWANVDGNANYSLSVPYTWTLKSAPALDWGSVVAEPPGEQATIERVPVKRVQLAMNGTALPSATLRVRVYYTTIPEGFKATYVLCATRISGFTALNNCTISRVGSAICVVEGTASNNSIILEGFNGTAFTYIYGGSTRHYNLTSDYVAFEPGATITRWSVYYTSTGLIINAATEYTVTTDPLEFFNIDAVMDWYMDVWDFLAYAVVLLVPVSVYIKSKSVGAAAVTLLFLAAGGAVLDESFRPIAILIIVGSLGVLAYKVFWPKD